MCRLRAGVEQVRLIQALPEQRGELPSRGFSRAIAKLQWYFRGLEVAKAELAVKYWMWKRKGQTSPRIQGSSSEPEWMDAWLYDAPKGSHLARCSCTGNRGMSPALPSPMGTAGWPRATLSLGLPTALSQRWPLHLTPQHPEAALLGSPPDWTPRTLEQKQYPNNYSLLPWQFFEILNLI